MSTLFLIVLLPVLILIVLVALSWLLSMDWSRRHRLSTNELPLVDSTDLPEDGLIRIAVGDLIFRARVANLHGSGDALILLHGFPQTSIAWEPVIAAAAAKGHRVVAFDQRGYSANARPRGTRHYGIDALAADVLGVADALGIDRFHLAGHDWGAAVGWATVMRSPKRVSSWTALSIAHPLAFGEALRSDADQRRRSRYILLFRLPVIAEALLGFNRLMVFRRLMYRWMPPEHGEEYLRVFAEPGALTAILSWYRAMGGPDRHRRSPEIVTPVLFIWGNNDPAAGSAAVALQDQYITGPYSKKELDAGHWLLERRTDVVVSAILEHLASHSDRAQ